MSAWPHPSRHVGGALAALLLAACGGGGGGGGSGTGESTGTTPPVTAPSPSTVYSHSLAIGSWAMQPITYVPAATPNPASITTAIASGLLGAGTKPLAFEHTDAAYPGVRVACISGHGEFTNVVGPINLGVIAQSAAVLLDAGWSEQSDRVAAWTAIAGRRAELSGWENCGVKPEGAPSRSSRLTPSADGGYVEDVFDGNPGTTVNVITRTIPREQMAAMLSEAGYAGTTDPARPLQLSWRVYADGAGRQLLIQMGVPTTGAPASTTGFIALYTAS